MTKQQNTTGDKTNTISKIDWDQESLKFRPYKNNFDDSIKQVKEFRDIRDLAYYIFGIMRGYGALRSAVQIGEYSGEDVRIGWRKTCVVTVDGYGVFGFTNGYGRGMPGMKVIVTEKTLYDQPDYNVQHERDDQD